MKLIVISSSGTIENEAQIMTQLFEAGLETFHLRKHKLSTKRTKALLNEIPKHFHNRIVIHSHHSLARKFNLKGIHLTKSHKSKKWRLRIALFLLRLKNPNAILTTSFTSIGHLFEEQEQAYAYAFLSPIFDSLSSKFQGGFTEHSLKSALEKSQIKIIARGGVNITSIEKANSIKFEGLAFYTDIWKKKDPLAEFKLIIEKFEELKIQIE